MDLPDPSATILLDLDGTLTDSFPGIESSFRHGLTSVGVAIPSDDVIAGIAGPPMLDTLRSIGLDDHTADAAFTAYREQYLVDGWLQNTVYVGIPELLTDLRAAGRTLAVATSKTESTAVQVLEHFDLARHFDYIGGAGDGELSRATKDEVIEYVMEHVPGPYVMVGDRSHDIHGAARFGIPSVHVTWGYARPGEADDATWSVDTVDELRALLLP